MADDDTRATLDAEREAARKAHERELEALRAERESRRQAYQEQRDALRRERDLLREAAKDETEASKRERDRRKEDAKDSRETYRQERDRQREAAKEERDRRRDALKDDRERRRETAKDDREARRSAAKDDREVRKDARDLLPADVAVLWRTEPAIRRGPRPGLTLDDIADAGVAIADAEGIDAVSMARVADRLGYTAMSLYRYVSSKDEVVALMLDRASGEPPATDPTAGWRPRLEVLLAAQQRGVAMHPWIATTMSVFTVLGPHRAAWMDAMLATLAGTGLSGTQRMAIIGALANQALADARAMAALSAQARRSAEAGELAGLDALLAAIADPARYPALAASLADGSAERPTGTPVDALTPGMRLLLDGVATWITAASQGRPSEK